MRVLLAIVLVAAAGLIGWRVLRPSEVVEAAALPYPAAEVVAPGVTGKTALAPLIVDERIRVYAGKRVVKADSPISATTMYTPLWSYRRWPAQVSGVVAAGATVVSRWSDGLVVALDGRTGRVVWRTGGPAADPFAEPTGSDAVWDPAGLSVSGSAVLVSGAAFSLETGRPTAVPVAEPASLSVTAANGVVKASGAASWEWTGEAIILGVRPQKVILLAANQTLVELDARTGAELTSFRLYTTNERVEPWQPRRWHLTGNWLTLERVDYPPEPVIIAAL
ncbi:hypothetical protein [Actinoplanes sp. TFC3]|uniref:hypothetical protein n=1 Tax=Actinoplanes sp. TFC3 TaxID=1710355 RepID=UPI00128FD491|nr:hypothetical protein [Actinoplanes sp. TFC3]